MASICSPAISLSHAGRFLPVRRRCLRIRPKSAWNHSEFQISADAHKQQEQSGTAVASAPTRSATVLADQEQRKALKFGLSSKGGTSKNLVMLQRSRE